MITDTMVFLAGVSLTLVACVVVVIYLRNHLERILVLLCGTPEPAKFWTVFTNVTLILTPIVFALSYQPDTHLGRSAIFELSNQLRLGLAGLVFSVLIMGIVINRSHPLAHAPALKGCRTRSRCAGYGLVRPVEPPSHRIASQPPSAPRGHYTSGKRAPR
jgi:hypothetical protein